MAEQAVAEAAAPDLAEEAALVAVWRHEPMDASNRSVVNVIGTLVTELDSWVCIRAATDQVTAAAAQRHELLCKFTNARARFSCCVLTGGFGSG